MIAREKLGKRKLLGLLGCIFHKVKIDAENMDMVKGDTDRRHLSVFRPVCASLYRVFAFGVVFLLYEELSRSI